MAYYGPTGETSSDIFLERTFLASGFLEGVGYGAQLIVYGATVHCLWQRKEGRKRSYILLTYITVLFILNTFYAAFTARGDELDYIDDRNYPGGPLAYFNASGNIPINVGAQIVYFLGTFFADALQFYRSRVILSAFHNPLQVWSILALPFLLLVASFVIGVFFNIQIASPGISLYSHIAISLGVPYFITTFSMNVILTIIVIIRLLVHRRSVQQILGEKHGRAYTSLIALLIESAAMYSVVALTLLVTYGINNPINQIFLGISTPVQLISIYLIIYRMAQGHAWARDTLKSNQVHSNLVFRSRQVDSAMENARGSTREDSEDFTSRSMITSTASASENGAVKEKDNFLSHSAENVAAKV